jgi:ribosome maturation factor RimP
MNLIEKQIINLCETVVLEKRFMFIDFVFRGHKNLQIIELYIDSENGVSVEDCAEVSREIRSRIETENLLEGNYRLDVSSPGVERPLKFLEQYKKHINRNFDLRFVDQEGNEKSIKGKLLKIESDNLLFAAKNEEYLINFNKIIKALVNISFS